MGCLFSDFYAVDFGLEIIDFELNITYGEVFPIIWLIQISITVFFRYYKLWSYRYYEALSLA
jgi:hypothetical protein